MADYAGKGVWCVAELRRGNLVSTLYELQTAGGAIAKSLGEPLCAVILGGPGKAQAAAKSASDRGGWDKVYVVEHAALENFNDEAFAKALADAIDKEHPNKVLLPASAAGRSLAARTAVLSHGSLASDATAVTLDDAKHLLATRTGYGGNLLVTIAVKKGPEFVSLRPMAYSRSETGGAKGEIVAISVDPGAARMKFLSFAAEESKEIDMSSAEKIVSGGRGLGNAEGFKLIYDFAHSLGAGVGASRAVVDSGWIPYRHQVGLTGRTVRPRLYVACGISGQIQHLAGMSSSDIVVAINTDPDCPMMKLATFAVQGDLYQIIPAVIAEIKRQRGEAAQPAAAAH